MTYRDGQAWRSGPHEVYRRFAAAALDVLDRDLTGLATVDVGAGTGAMGAELAARGARVVSTDRELAMVREAPLPRFVGDVLALALRDRCLDLAAANFVLSHVRAPLAALAELARVTRCGGLVLATGFPTGAAHPVKAAVDAVLAGFGYQPPQWYLRLKDVGEARVGDPMALSALAAQAGLRGVRIVALSSSLLGLDLQTVVSWRLGMAQVCPFLAAQPAHRRDQIRSAARAAVTEVGLADPVRLLLLAAEA